MIYDDYDSDYDDWSIVEQFKHVGIQVASWK